MEIDIYDIYKPTPYTGTITVDLLELKNILQHYDVDMNPPYQRPSCWSVDQQERFMGHLLSGGEVMPIIIQRIPDGGPQEVLDGKQRLEAILSWLDGKCAARLPNGKMINIQQLPLRAYGTSLIPKGLQFVSITFKYVNMPFEERKLFYVKFNSAGTPHTKEDIEHALQARPKE